MRPRSPYPPPLTAPPSWLSLLGSGNGGPGAGDDAAADAGDRFPGEGWPKLETIEYISKLIILVVLLLALPWLLGKLITAPGEVSGHSAGLAMGPASMGA